METLPEIVAARIVLPDATGTPRIVLAVDEQGEASIRLFDRHGHEQAALVVIDPDRCLKDPPPKELTIAQLTLGGADDGAGVNLLARSDGNGVIEVTGGGETGAPIAALEINKKDDSSEARLMLAEEGATMELAARDHRVLIGGMFDRRSGDLAMH